MWEDVVAGVVIVVVVVVHRWSIVISWKVVQVDTFHETTIEAVSRLTLMTITIVEVKVISEAVSGQ